MPFASRIFHAPALFSAILLACGASTTSRAAAEALLLMEAESGKVLYSENATQPWYPASVTKLMTAYVTLRAVKEQKLALDTLLTVSLNAVAQAPSKMGFKAGTQITVDNALKMLMVKSANDIAVVLAEGVSGSIDNFSAEMNKTAQRLGMTQTSYVNPNGLPAEGQITSARDLAILARALLREFPEHDLYWHISAIRLGKRVMRNYNTLIDRYAGADGMKTGFICSSGFNLVASATRNGRRLIAVVLGAPSSPVRAVKAAQLLERGFNTGPLTWLTPAVLTVDQLPPLSAAPPDLREAMCGKHRKRPAAETEDSRELDETVNAQIDSNEPAFKLSAFSGKPSSLIGPLTASMDPIPVYVGLKNKPEPDKKVAAKPKKSTPTAEAKAAKPVSEAKAAKPASTAGKAQPPVTNGTQISAPAFAPAAPAYPSPSAFAPKPANAAPANANATPAKDRAKTAAKPAEQKAKSEKPKAAKPAQAEATAKGAAQPATKPEVQ